MDNGITWSSTATTPNYTRVKSIFVTDNNTIYIGTHKGNIFYSNNRGLKWTAMPAIPAMTSSINSLYVYKNTFYVGSDDGNVYYSPDGINWTTINGSPDGSPVRGVFVGNNTLYVNTRQAMFIRVQI